MGEQAVSLNQSLWVTIVGATGLHEADTCGKGSDPYCILEIPGKPRSKIKTQALDSTLNPVWNHESEIVDYSPGDDLKFSVWDKDPGGNFREESQDDPLGQAVLPSRSFHPGGFTGQLMFWRGSQYRTSLFDGQDSTR